MYYVGNLHSLRLGFKTRFINENVARFEKCKVAKVMVLNCNKQINAKTVQHSTLAAARDWNAYSGTPDSCVCVNDLKKKD